MIEITFTAPHRRHGVVEWEVVAVLHIEGTQLEVEGDQDFAEVRDIELLDVDTGQTVTCDADPERWARNLPQAFRSGDLVCRLTADSAPHASDRDAIATNA
jgi:hypothetical protein